MKYGLVILGVLLFESVFAYQRLPAEEGAAITAYVSETSLNRIAVFNDRIVNVKGNSGEFELDTDQDLGQIFIKPVLSDKPIALFVTTEKGHTYSLHLMSQQMNAENIVLMPLEENAIAQWEKTGSYESALKTILKAMHTDNSLEGFVIEKPHNKLPKIPGMNLTLLKSYRGAQWIGDIIEVSNQEKEPLYLSEAEFYQANIRAIAILDKVLAPQAKTRLYWVRNT